MKPTISSASGPSRTPAPNQPQPLRFLLDAIIAAPTPHNSQTNTPRNIRGNARLLSADQLFEPVPHNAPTALQLQAVLSVIFHGRTASISEPRRISHDPAAQISSAPQHYNCKNNASRHSPHHSILEIMLTPWRTRRDLLNTSAMQHEEWVHESPHAHAR